MSFAADDKETPMDSDREPDSDSTLGASKSCQTKPREKRPVSTIRLLKEDFDVFKQDFINIFRDKDEKKPETKDKRPLSGLKEDLNQFREDLSGILRKGLRKEDAFRVRAQDQTGQRGDAEKEDQTGRDQTGKDQTGQRGDAEKEEDTAEFWAESWELVGEDELKQNGGTLEVKEKKDRGAVPAINTDAQSCERDDRCDGGSKLMVKDEDLSKEEEEDTVLGQESLISLSSGISLLRLRDISQNQQRGRLGGDVWAVKNFTQYLTLDPNTANPELLLSDGNRTARRVWGRNHVTDQVPDQLSDHPERFEHCPQVLCREGLLDAVYWEVEWTGGADVGVTYNSITRRGQVRDGLLGHNQGSWSLECSEGSYTPCHHQRRFRSVSPQPFSRTVGVFLDFEAGSLSFYCVYPEAMLHLHTFSSTFTEPLYPGFWLWAWGGSVSLSQVKLDWERLLQ